MKLPATATLFAAVLAACAHSGFEAAQKEDTPEAWTRFLREHGDDPTAPAVRRRLAEAEFEGARRQNTILAYKRFLGAWPEAERRKDAEVLLENLRFEAAAKEDSPAAWLDFLREHPAGAHVVEAHARLVECDWQRALSEGTAHAIEEFDARHPDSPHEPEVARLVDDRSWAEAQAGGPRAMVAYLEKNPAGVHRDEARGALAEREAMARAFLGEFDAARSALERVPGAEARRRTAEAVERAQMDSVGAAFDPKALEAFAFSREGAVADEARARAKALQKDRALLKGLADRLDPAHWARPADELMKVLQAADPRERWLAAEELGRMGARPAVDALLDAAALSRFSRVRERAFQALRGLYALLPQDIKDVEVRARLEALRKVAASPALQVKLGLLEELLGEEAQAIADYQKAVKGDQTDLFVLRRLTALKAARKETFGVATEARELAGRVQQLVEQRAQEEGLSPMLLSRTLCGARDDARAAVEALQKLPPEAARDFPEDLQLFQRRAADALSLVAARLADTEAEARGAERGFRGCDDDGGMLERLGAGEADRVKVVSELARRSEEAVRAALSLSARRDPCAAVREAAQATLQRASAK